MLKAEEIFEELKVQFQERNEVHEGKMMSSRGLQYKGKNFLFNWNENMCFRLGRDFDPGSEGIHHYSLLNPFKTKPPLKDWLVLSSDFEKWPLLAEVAFEKMKKELG